MMMMIQSQVGTPPDFSDLTGAVAGFGRGFAARAPVGDGADGPSARGMVVTRFVGSAGATGCGGDTGGAGGVGTVTGSRRPPGATDAMPTSTA